MKIDRTPVTKPSEKHSVTLYQVKRNDKDGFARNMLGMFVGQFIPMDRMEPVYSTLKDGDTDDILNECFRKFNTDEHINQHFLNYSMSVGDIIQIDNECYRCTMTGWEKV